MTAPDQMLHQRQKVLAMAPSTHDPSATSASISCCSSEAGFSLYQSTRLIRYDTSSKCRADMRRRELIGLIGGAAAAWPLTALAQQRNQKPRIGILSDSSASKVRSGTSANCLQFEVSRSLAF